MIAALMTRHSAQARLAASFSFLLASASLLAQQPWVGPRFAGMAGAQTASANDALALWANPAGLGIEPRLEVNLFGSPVATDRGHFVSAVNVLSVLDPNNLTPPQAVAALAALTNLNRPGVGLVASGVAGFVVAEKGLAIGVGDVAYAAVYPNVDLAHISPANFSQNTSGVNSIGLEARELRIGYAYPLYGRTVLVGAAVRYIWGRTYYNHTSVFDLKQDNLGSIIVESLKQNEKGTKAFTFDVGAIVNVLSTVKVGIVSSALTNPKFDVKQSTVNPTLLGAPTFVRLPRTVRAGAAVTPLSALTVAVDYDLVASDTLLPGGKSRQLSGGFEVKVPLFSLRGGTWRDFEAPDPHWSYSVGFGLNLAVLSIDAAVVLSQEGGLKLKAENRRDLGAAVGARFRF